MIQSNNQSASVANDNHKIEVIPTILEDGSVKTKFIVWEKN